MAVFVTVLEFGTWGGRCEMNAWIRRCMSMQTDRTVDIRPGDWQRPNIEFGFNAFSLISPHSLLISQRGELKESAGWSYTLYP